MCTSSSSRFGVSLVLAGLFVSAAPLLVACSSDDDPPAGTGIGVGTGGNAGGGGLGSLATGGRAGAGGAGAGGVGGAGAGGAGAGGAAPTGPDYVGTGETTTPFFGSTGGQPTATPGIPCAKGEVLVGLQYRQDPAGSYQGSIIQLRAICAELEDVGTAVTTKPATVSVDRLGGRQDAFPDIETRCAPNQAVIKLQVLRKSTAFNYPYELVIGCAAFGPSAPTLTVATESAAATKTSQAGTIDAGTASCPTGQVATGLDGLVGSEVDRIGLVCATMAQNR